MLTSTSSLRAAAARRRAGSRSKASSRSTRAASASRSRASISSARATPPPPSRDGARVPRSSRPRIRAHRHGKASPLLRELQRAAADADHDRRALSRLRALERDRPAREESTRRDRHAAPLRAGTSPTGAGESLRGRPSAAHWRVRGVPSRRARRAAPGARRPRHLLARRQALRRCPDSLPTALARELFPERAAQLARRGRRSCLFRAPWSLDSRDQTGEPASATGVADRTFRAARGRQFELHPAAVQRARGSRSAQPR